MDNYNYPMGADTKDAPWNELSPPKEVTFDVCISQTLSRDTTVATNNYFVEIDCDEDGCHESINTSETDWRKAYEKDRMTPLNLIKEFKGFLEKTLPDPIVFPMQYKRAKYLIGECEGWVEDDLEIIEN